MRRFVKTTVPADGYEEIRKVGERYIVHMEPVSNGDGSVTCYECMTNDEPDMEVLARDLEIYKEYINQIELKIAKSEKCKEIQDYDISDNVNSFEIRRGGEKFTDYWIDRDLRTSLEGDVKACKEISDTYKFDIREFGVTLELDCDKFLTALISLRQYAYTAYNVTSQHLSNVNNLTTVEEVQNYDYTQDYPQKLIFNIEDLI